jgi:hypothetical protein
MESNMANLRSKRRTAAEIKELLSEQRESNCTVKEFCAVRGINEGTFFNWRKKYSASQPVNGDFISLQVNKTDAAGSLFAEIEHPGKAVIRLFGQVDPSYLKALL